MDDVDMQRAVAASLSDAPGASEDDELFQALAASVQSGDGVSEELINTLRECERTPGAPVALVAPMTIYQVATHAIQALLAAGPFQKALQSAAKDQRVLPENYWSGEQPEALTDTSAAASTSLIQRLQTLAAYTAQTNHAAVITGDLAAAIPRDILLLASQGDAYGLLESLIDAIAALYADDTQMSLTQDPAFAEARDHLFRSYAAPAVAGAPVPSLEDSLLTNSITLRHTQSSTNVSSCLWSKLAGSGDSDSILITTPAQVLALPVVHATNTPRFQIDEVIYLDPFLWEKRNGERIDIDDRWRQIDIYDETCAELCRQREKLVSPSGRAIEPLIKTVQEHLTSASERVEKNSELNQWLTKTTQLLSSRVKDIDRSLDETRKAAAECKAKLLAEAAERDANPEFQTVPYSLCAALFASDDQLWAYVRSEQKWWLVEDGAVTLSSWETLANDDRGSAASEGVYMLCYEQGKSI
ncbi:hypothetical protein MCUN1_001462 [Malassezia cuniculi]|uniref:Uncharacterized protein n=1 Tax=Malassezia cuniculi TaxID=948313 RepID=A0AAF0JAT0_9BASI|nr:hypothetical protein MCUN1_001462 [Malassezia cuniculi]